MKPKNKHNPPRCTLCDVEINSTVACIAHLSSKRHLENIGGICGCSGANQCQEKESQVISLLTCPTQREVHLALGFKVDEILSAAATGTGRPHYDGVKDQAILIPPELNWLVEDCRFFVGWDGVKERGTSVMPLTKAASITDSLHRLRVDQAPPVFRAPSLPMRLPATKQHVTKLQWPHSPGILLPFASFRAKGKTLEGIDFIASTSLLNALSGSPKHMNETFLLQKVESAIAVQDLQKKAHDSKDIGPLVESLCCPTASPTLSSHSVSMFTIDSKTFVFANEVDGYDPDTSETVEIKARKEKRPTKMKDLLMQIMLNGSSRIVNFSTSKDGTHLESSVTYSRDEILNLNQEHWIYTGQRIKYLIRHILACSTVKNA